MSISSHLGIVVLVVIGVVTAIGVAIIGAIETKRMEKGESSIISSLLKKWKDDTEKKRNVGDDFN